MYDHKKFDLKFLKQICIRLSIYFVITKLNRKTVSKSSYIGEIEQKNCQ